MKTRTSFCAVALAVSAFAATLSAQQLAPSDPSEPAIKFQVKNFESNLRLAVLKSGQEVSEKARRIVPSVDLQYVSDVGINGWWTPETGYTFDVVVPDILPTSLSLIVWMQNQLNRTPAGSTAPGGGNAMVVTSAAAPVPGDPTKVSSVVPFNPSREYSDLTRQALIDALVDFSGGLQFKTGQSLQIVAGPTPAQMPNPLQPESRKLILTVKGEDLLAFRKGDLKREDLVAKIQERRF